MTHYVIIGNSVASIAAVEAIRDQDKDGTITIISDEPHLAYSRPLISCLLAGKVSEESMLYRDRNFYKINKVELLSGKKAIALDPKKKLVTLADKKKISFDKLLIATGGTPIFPKVRGKNLEGIFTLTKWGDVKRIKKYIDKSKVKEVVVVGGGLIGLKTVEGLMELKIRVSIIELADRILSATFDKKASNLIESRLKKMGCKVITENTVAKIRGKKKVAGVILKDGVKLDCDMVIFAIGVAPNVKITKGTGIKVNMGILVDRRMQTNIPDIYAAGDVVEGPDLIAGGTRPIAIWPTAYKQGSIAGSNMGGVLKEYVGSFAMNSIELCDLPTISVGLTDPKEEGYEVLDYYDEENFVYKKVVLKGNTIVGAIFVNDIDRAGIYTGLITDKVDVSGFKEYLLKEDFGLLSLPKEYRKHLVSGPGIEV